MKREQTPQTFHLICCKGNCYNLHLLFSLVFFFPLFFTSEGAHMTLSTTGTLQTGGTPAN